MKQPKYNLVEDCELLPSFDGSNHFLQLLFFEPNQNYVRGERVYFDQNSKIDGKRLTAVEVHYNDTRFLGSDYDMFRDYALNGIPNVEVVPFSAYQNILLTLASADNSQSIERIPASSFYFVPNTLLPVTGAAAPKMRKPLDLVIRTGKSFIELTIDFTASPTGLVIPISFYYEDK